MLRLERGVRSDLSEKGEQPSTKTTAEEELNEACLRSDVAGRIPKATKT